MLVCPQVITQLSDLSAQASGINIEAVIIEPGVENKLVLSIQSLSLERFE